MERPIRQAPSSGANTGITSELMLSETPMTEVGVIGGYYEKVYPTFPIDNPSTPIEFSVLPSVHYTKLSETYLVVSGSVTDKNGSKIAKASTTCAPTTNFLHSLFQNFEVEVGNKNITPNSNFYPYLAFFETLCTLQFLKRKTKC